VIDDNRIFDFGDAASVIKEAIIRSRYQAAKLVNKELLSLYYSVGKYVVRKRAAIRSSLLSGIIPNLWEWQPTERRTRCQRNGRKPCQMRTR
jgi:hypothetical protein